MHRLWETFDSKKHVIKNLGPNGTYVSFWGFDANYFIYVGIGTIAPNGEIRILAEYKEKHITIDDFIIKYQQYCKEIGADPLVDYCDPVMSQHKGLDGFSIADIMFLRGLNPEYCSCTIGIGIIIGNSVIQKDLLCVDPKCTIMIEMLENHRYSLIKDGSYSHEPERNQYEAISGALIYLFINEHRYLNKE